VLLLWVYYSALILLFGAEFTQVYARRTGSWAVPSPHARPVAEQERVQEGVPHEASDASPANARSAEPYLSAEPHLSRSPTPRAKIREPATHPFQLAVLVGTAFLLPILVRRQGIKLIKELATMAKQRRPHPGRIQRAARG
jgi:membrane protein